MLRYPTEEAGMRALWVVAVAATFACKSPEERIIEAATGGKVDIEKGKITIEGEDGRMTVKTDDEGGKLTVTNEKGEKATLDGKTGTMRVVSEDGVAEWGTGKLPEDFPLSLLDDAEVMTSSRTEEGGKKSFHVMAKVDATPKEVADFYAGELKAKGLKKVKRAEHSMGAGAMVTLSGRNKKLNVAVSAVRENAGDETVVTLAWSER
jgi:hypothetical protein